jgi:hypothetical protein
MATFTEIYDEFVKYCEENDNDFEVSILLTYPLTEEETQKWSKSHVRHECHINYDEKELFFDYFTCSNEYPESKELISGLVDDAKSAYHNDNFEDFCSAFGYSDDSIKALKIYESCKDMKDKLLDLFGEKLFTRFMACEMDV